MWALSTVAHPGTTSSLAEDQRGLLASRRAPSGGVGHAGPSATLDVGDMDCMPTFPESFHAFGSRAAGLARRGTQIPGSGYRDR